MPKGQGKIDKVLLISVILIAVLGVIFLYSATYERGSVQDGLHMRLVKQCLWVIIGIVLLASIASMDYIRILDFAYFSYAANLLLLVFLLFFGGERYGARRWIDLGFFSLQPSEFIKITAIFTLAAFLGSRRERKGSFANFILSFMIIAPGFLLIFLQPDLGTSLVLIPILFSILLICGENLKYMVTVIVMGLASMPVMWSLLKDYQKSRLLVFINPNIDPLGAGYTIIQSRIAIGSGGFSGKGFLSGTQSHLNFLPERQTDFIFSVVGEEWGFIGAVLLIGLFSLVIFRGIKIMNSTDDTAGKAIAAGVVTLLAFQVMVNISMTIGLMPVVGLPLPMISYGGSNTLVALVSMGFLLSVSRRSHR
jgi:rod shape determining protein RodA